MLAAAVPEVLKVIFMVMICSRKSILALALGLVNRVVPAESFLAEALKLAEQIAAQPPLATKAAKKSILNAVDSSVEESLAFERAAFYALFDSQDQKEGMKAFIEKRKANFTGK